MSINSRRVVPVMVAGSLIACFLDFSALQRNEVMQE